MELTRSQARKAELQAKRQNAMKGSGMYIYQNNTKGEIMLPRHTATHRPSVAAGNQFVGDSYYMYMVKTGDLRLVEIIEENSMPEKLITEQPPTVTTDGVVEYTSPPQTDEKKEEEVLLTENPMGGVTIL